MRLICGFLRLDDAPASRKSLDAMVDALAVSQRPARRSDICEGPVALAILDYARNADSAPAAQPLHFVADVRLDEPEELARRMGMAAVCHDRLLLEAATTPGMLQHVLGDFAFALWDAQAETLTCGRDGFGIRPLSYVHRPGELFAFASLPAALHGSGIVPRIVDRDAAIRRALRDLRYDDSLIAGIKRLPPAHVLSVSRAGVSIERYWQLDRAAVGVASVTPEHAAAELRRRIEQAVRSRTPAGMNIGSHLSGGLDSSAVAILAARNLREDGRRLCAYSFLDRHRNDVKLEDETDYVAACLEQEADIDWQAIRAPTSLLTQEEPLDVDTMIPLTDAHAEVRVVGAAAAQGVDLILCGWGGDEASTFNGRGTLPELLRRGKLRTLAREIRGAGRERGTSTKDVVLRELVLPLVPDRLLQMARGVLAKKGAPANLGNVIGRDVREDLGPSRESLEVSDGREARWRLINSPHLALQAETSAQMGARHGVAFAFPLLDRRVVEYALSLPSEFFLRDGVPRRVFRDAMKGVLPERVRTRPHKYLPFPGWLIEIADRQDMLRDRLAEYRADPGLSETLDFGILDDLAAQFPSGAEARAYGGRNARHPAAAAVITVVNAMTLARYLRGSKDDG